MIESDSNSTKDSVPLVGMPGERATSSKYEEDIDTIVYRET